MLTTTADHWAYEQSKNLKHFGNWSLGSLVFWLRPWVFQIASKKLHFLVLHNSQVTLTNGFVFSRWSLHAVKHLFGFPAVTLIEELWCTVFLLQFLHVHFCSRILYSRMVKVCGAHVFCLINIDCSTISRLVLERLMALIANSKLRRIVCPPRSHRHRYCRRQRGP